MIVLMPLRSSTRGLSTTPKPPKSRTPNPKPLKHPKPLNPRSPKPIHGHPTPTFWDSLETLRPKGQEGGATNGTCQELIDKLEHRAVLGDGLRELEGLLCCLEGLRLKRFGSNSVLLRGRSQEPKQTKLGFLTGLTFPDHPC